VAAVGEQTYLTDLTTSPGRIGCRVTQGTAQSGWTSTVVNTLTFGTEDFDWGDLFDSGTSTTKILIGMYPGLWLVSGLFAVAQNSAITRHMTRLALNGTAINGGITSTGDATAQFVSIPLPATLVVSTLSTDYIEMQAAVTGTGTLGTAVSTELRCAFQALFIGTQS
jgi:hypothetical protein